jgi:cytochrome c biogenesis protein CcdA
MNTLLAVLTPIALLNSLSFLPSGIPGIAATLGARKPMLTASALIAGKFVPNFAFGLLIAIGLDISFDQLEARARDAWQDPEPLVVGLQLIIGAVMFAFAYRLSRSSQRRPSDAPSTLMTPVGAFSVSAGLALVGLPSALLYFAAIDQVLRADLTALGIVKALLFFNLICLLPLMLIVVSRGLLGTRSDPLFGAVARFIERWGRRLMFVGLFVLGVVLTLDAIGWFLGLPLLPSYLR